MAEQASLYDFPEFYDILFGWDRDGEADFYDHALTQCGLARGAPILEVAAGTAQVGIRLARKGWDVTVLDTSAAMVSFAMAAASAHDVVLHPCVADMTAFSASGRFEGALNPMSSLRLLLRDEEVLAHLGCMARAVRPNGAYIVDVAFGTDGTAESDLDEWETERDGVTVTATTQNVHVVDIARNAEMTLDWQESLRPYTPAGFADLIARSGTFRVTGCYPERPRDLSGISTFARTLEPDLPAQGRAIVVLRRTE